MFNFIKYCAYFIVLIGATNWGLVGFFNFDLVAFLFGEMTTVTRIIYAAVGISAIISLVTFSLCTEENN